MPDDERTQSRAAKAWGKVRYDLSLWITRLSRWFSGGAVIPSELRPNFRHLYLDIAWFGLLNGTIIAFQAIYATRLGATAFQIGILSAVPAVSNITFTLPVGQWLKRIPTDRAVFWASVASRFFYVFLIPLPTLLAPKMQIWTIILLTLLLSIPGTMVAIGINALMAETVPVEWRGHVAGIRNAALAVVSMLVALVISGPILSRMTFPTGYQVLFAIGFLGAAMSSLHLHFIRLPKATVEAANKPSDAVPSSLDDQPHMEDREIGLRSEPRRLVRRLNQARGLQIGVLRGPFLRVLLLLFTFNLFLYAALPIFPVYQVKVLNVTDGVISIGSSLVWLAIFVTSMQMGRISRRFGNHKVTAIGMMFAGLSPIIYTLGRTTMLYLIIVMLTGFFWAPVGASLMNYLLDRLPKDDLPSYLAWYNLTLHIAVLIGSLGGPLVANQIGMTAALIVFGVCRVIAGLVVLRWG